MNLTIIMLKKGFKYLFFCYYFIKNFVHFYFINIEKYKGK